MPTLRHKIQSRNKSSGFRPSVISLAVLGSLLAGPVVTDAHQAFSNSRLSLSDSPLLADTRDYDWRNPDNVKSREQPKERVRERNQELPRDRAKGPGPVREGYQPPPRQTSKGPGPAREQHQYQSPPRGRSDPARERYREPPPRGPVKSPPPPVRYQEPPQARERYHDDHQRDRHDRDEPVRWYDHDRDRDRGYFEPRHYPPPRDRGFFAPRYPRHSRDVVVVRPFRYIYPPHYRHYHDDDNIWGLLSFTAITLAIIDLMNDEQQREHEMALYSATNLPLGETIYWRNGDASGAITPIQDGTSSSGRYCREFQQEVTIGGREEELYGTACQNPDGSWEIVE